MNHLISTLLLLILSSGIQAAELAKPTQTLNETDITYNYTSGRSYNVRFTAAGVSYRYLSGSKPKKWWGPFPYQAFEIESNVYFASWFEKDYGDYVTLLINFNNNLLYGSAILSAEKVHFHGAKIIRVTRR